jgi:uncharacterized zinc-type alcohol dehydrogenase-like protein
MTGTYNSYEEGQRFHRVATPQVLPLMKSILHISDKLELSGVAPLLCAGIYSITSLNVGKGHKVGV